MKYKLLILCVLLLLGAVSVYAESDLCSYATEAGIVENVELPGFIPYKNEVMNIYVGNSIAASIVVEDGVLTNINCDNEESEYTYKITLDSVSTLSDIMEADSAVDAFNDKLKDKSLKIEGKGVMRKVTTFFIKAGAKIAGLFA